MASKIEFVKLKKENINGTPTEDAVVVKRDGYEIARLPEADRLDRAMQLDLGTVSEIANNFKKFMGRQPNDNERQFWQALRDYKQNHNT